MPVKTLPLVNFKLAIKSGGTDDPIGKKGCSLITAELLNKGAGGRSAMEFLNKIEFLGGTLHANATQDLSIITGSFLKSKAQEGLKLSSEMVMNPDFNKQEFLKCKHRLMSAIKGINDNPEALSSVYYQRLFYNDTHPYAMPVHGSQSTVSTINISDISEYFQSAYYAENAVMSVVGDFDSNSMLKSIETQFGNWDNTSIPDPVIHELNCAEGVQIFVIDKPEIVQTQIKIGAPGIKIGHPSYFPLTIANTVFGGSFTSRLMQSVRVKAGLTYNINSGFSSHKYQGPFTISTFTKNESVGLTISTIFEELHKFRENGINQNELKSAQNYISGTYPLTIETYESLAAQLTRIHCSELPENWITDYIPNIQSQKIQDINAAISEYFPRKSLVIVLITNAEKVIPQLDGIGTIQVIKEDLFS